MAYIGLSAYIDCANSDNILKRETVFEIELYRTHARAHIHTHAHKRITILISFLNIFMFIPS